MNDKSCARNVDWGKKRVRPIPRYWPKERVPQMIFLDDGKTYIGPLSVSDAGDNNARGHSETSINENGHAMLYVISFY